MLERHEAFVAGNEWKFEAVQSLIVVLSDARQPACLPVFLKEFITCNVLVFYFIWFYKSVFIVYIDAYDYYYKYVVICFFSIELEII